MQEPFACRRRGEIDRQEHADTDHATTDKQRPRTGELGDAHEDPRRQR